MIDSVIASNHHFYILFLESTKIKNLVGLVKFFGEKSDYKLYKSKGNEFCHLQLELDKAYGSEVLLQMNISKDKKSTPKYWYDFYLGKVDLNGKNCFYICYPYMKLAKYLDQCFFSKSLNTIYYKPNMSEIINYFKNRDINGLSIIETNGVNTDITKYSAEVTESDVLKSKTRVNIAGENPLESTVYGLISQSESVNIETTSMKLRCQEVEYGEFELSFDRLGNYRFWLKKNMQNSVIPIIQISFKFLMDIAPMQGDNLISSNTLLENNE